MTSIRARLAEMAEVDADCARRDRMRLRVPLTHAVLEEAQAALQALVEPWPASNGEMRTYEVRRFTLEMIATVLGSDADHGREISEEAVEDYRRAIRGEVK